MYIGFKFRDVSFPFYAFILFFKLWGKNTDITNIRIVIIIKQNNKEEWKLWILG